VGQGHVDRRGREDQEQPIAEELNLPPVKIHCSVLAEDAIKAAIADYPSVAAGTGSHSGALGRHAVPPRPAPRCA
jgi:hypothetical protein